MGELENDMGLGDDLEGGGDTSLLDCEEGLLLMAASPVA